MVPKLISQSEFKSLVDSVNGRDRLIIKLLAGTGMRISELTRLKKADLDLDDRLIRLQAHKTKTRKYRDVVIPALLVPELKRWVKSFNHSEYVFPGQGLTTPYGIVEGTADRPRGRGEGGHPEGRLMGAMKPPGLILSMPWPGITKSSPSVRLNQDSSHRRPQKSV